jgi:predicted NUDIX family phosphoesterase
MSAAGKSAEQILLHLADDCFDGEASSDESKIKEFQIVGGLSDDEVDVARIHARILVRSHAAEIHILAKQLLQAGRGVYKIQ